MANREGSQDVRMNSEVGNFWHKYVPYESRLVCTSPNETVDRGNNRYSTRVGRAAGVGCCRHGPWQQSGPHATRGRTPGVGAEASSANVITRYRPPPFPMLYQCL
jgi:hypothetical protein